MQHNPNCVTAELNYYIINLGHLFWEYAHPRALAYTSQIPMKYSTISVCMICYQKLKLDMIERDLFTVIVLPRIQ
jgi:hypothetical protein